MAMVVQHQQQHKEISDYSSIAEETLAEFLSKATGTAVDWVQMPGMKPGPDSVGIFAISQSCSGVAARACGLVSLEPTKIVEILKDRPSWYRDCRSLEVFTMFPAGNGGTIELIYTQIFAPTTLAPARDFWTLRYTTSLENGSLVVCERSLTGSGAGPNPASATQFVKGKCYQWLIPHSCLAWNVPEVLRPLYESSKVVAQKMTIAALRYIRQIAQESSGEVVYGLGRQPAVLRTLSQRLSRRDHLSSEIHPRIIATLCNPSNSLAVSWTICNGIDEHAVGACFKRVFAPIDEMFPDDAPLIPSGFRIIPLDPKS
ncbi:homeobox-leucine zipper protein REVOLUTA, partial [Tanacetum coccineum]